METKVALLCASCRIINKDDLGTPIGVLAKGSTVIEGAAIDLCDGCLDAAERMGYEVERMVEASDGTEAPADG